MIAALRYENSSSCRRLKPPARLGARLETGNRSRPSFRPKRCRQCRALLHLLELLLGSWEYCSTRCSLITATLESMHGSAHDQRLLGSRLPAVSPVRTEVDVCAPGSRILSSVPPDNYAVLDSTSSSSTARQRSRSPGSGAPCGLPGSLQGPQRETVRAAVQIFQQQPGRSMWEIRSHRAGCPTPSRAGRGPGGEAAVLSEELLQQLVSAFGRDRRAGKRRRGVSAAARRAPSGRQSVLPSGRDGPAARPQTAVSDRASLSSSCGCMRAGRAADGKAGGCGHPGAPAHRAVEPSSANGPARAPATPTLLRAASLRRR